MVAREGEIEEEGEEEEEVDEGEGEELKQDNGTSQAEEVR